MPARTKVPYLFKTPIRGTWTLKSNELPQSSRHPIRRFLKKDPKEGVLLVVEGETCLFVQTQFVALFGKQTWVIPETLLTAEGVPKLDTITVPVVVGLNATELVEP